MDGTGTPLAEVVKGARGLMLRDPQITAVHIVDARPVDAFDRWWAESLVESDEMQLLHPRAANWIVARKPHAEPAAGPSAATLRARAMERLNAIGRWSAGFEGLIEGAR